MTVKNGETPYFICRSYPFVFSTKASFYVPPKLKRNLYSDLIFFYHPTKNSHQEMIEREGERESESKGNVTSR